MQLKKLSNTIPTTSEPSKVSGVAAEKVDGSSDDEGEKAVRDEQPSQMKNHKGGKKTDERSSITEDIADDKPVPDRPPAKKLSKDKGKRKADSPKSTETNVDGKEVIHEKTEQTSHKKKSATDGTKISGPKSASGTKEKKPVSDKKRKRKWQFKLRRDW
jgi:25S rRNA (cytosine2870-C5)-methyltransferase